MKFQQSRALNRGQLFTQGAPNGQGGRTQQFGQNQGLRPAAGEIITINNNSLTVKLQDGSSKIIILSDKTTINKASEASREDLQEGEAIAVFGQENSDGSITAQSIQLNPTQREMQVR